MNIRTNRWVSVVWVAFFCVSAAFVGQAQEKPVSAEVIQEVLAGPLTYLQSKESNLSLEVVHEELEKDEWKTQGRLQLIEVPGQVLMVDVHAGDRRVMLQKTAAATSLILPDKSKVFRGEGSVESENEMVLREMLFRVLEIDPVSKTLTTVLTYTPAAGVARIVAELIPEEYTIDSEEEGKWIVSGERENIVVEKGRGLTEVRIRDTERVRVDFQAGDETPDFPRFDTSSLEVVKVDRNNLERMIRRGLIRAAEIEYENNSPPVPADGVREVPHGRLEVNSGERLLLLSGTPRQIGLAHGQLLKSEIRKVGDSLYTVGLFSTIERGEYFPGRIREAWNTFEKHIPEHVSEELQGLAEGCGMKYEEVKLANFFPELFHCSGFAIAGDATIGGKLYHGRVLDYMTEIGIQHYSVVIVSQVPGKFANANISYAGFVGSVSGMNEKGISIGEMGGRGEGQWDGMPMAQLIRLALEQCSSLEETIQFFKETPRTCEYYYVIADGNQGEGVGVAAWPDRIDFIGMGETHPRLPEKVEDAVLLSAGNRYRTLVERTMEKYGEIDAQAAIRLMDDGVAMGDSNLHNVLFIPEDGVFYVANASGDEAAWEQPYIRYDLREILTRMPQ